MNLKLALICADMAAAEARMNFWKFQSNMIKGKNDPAIAEQINQQLVNAMVGWERLYQECKAVEHQQEG